MSAHYYNEIEPYAVAWLRNLMAEGLIPAGDIDTRSIEDVRPSDLAGYVQCHFFAGIGGWPLALALAGWPSDRPVWTGSCPCQPFSVAGKGDGAADKRHLWPAWFHLISQCRPSVVFGEQVAAAVGHQWLDGMCADLEGQGYAIGASVLPACAVGATHRRDRLWFVADTDCSGLETGGREGLYSQRGTRPFASQSFAGAMADADMQRRDGEHTRIWEGPTGRHAGRLPEIAGGCSSSQWHAASSVIGHDGKSRRSPEPSIRLLAHGLSARVGRLRAYGNAIVPQAAAQFISAYAEARGLIVGEAMVAA